MADNGELFRDERIVPIGATDSVIAGGQMRRHAFIISAPPTWPIFIRFAGPAAPGVGMQISPGSLPLRIDSGWVGHALREEIHCISPTGTQNIYILDVFTG